MTMQRRHFLQAGTAAALTPWAQLQALAATTDASNDYKALVCLFLYGGNDSNNLMVPTDTSTYSLYQRARPNLALPREQLVPIVLANTGGASYGLHPALAPLKPLFAAGQASVVANVGPLLVPTSRAQWQARSVPLPDNLFSHSDQQGAWQSGIADDAPRNGWGGRTLERVVPEGLGNRGYSAISVSGSNIWEGGDLGMTPYRVSSSGRFGFDFYDPAGKDPLSAAVASLLAETRSDPMEQTWLNVMGRSIDNQRILSAALSASTLKTVFPDTGLGRQLRMVAQLIAARGRLGLQRQCFFASLGGFDTHGDDQLQRQNEAFGEIAGAVAAFQAAMNEMDLARGVTLFTASDFGRNLPSNGQGTDHGWGGHQLVFGGGLAGARMVGRFPVLQVGGPDDAGQGVWIPTTSVDQLGGELARWFGAAPNLVEAVFPRLPNFESSIGLMAP